jgi:hypothetical protein
MYELNWENNTLFEQLPMHDLKGYPACKESPE